VVLHARLLLELLLLLLLLLELVVLHVLRVYHAGGSVLRLLLRRLLRARGRSRLLLLAC
jgi:hypothetical protein